MSKKAFQFAVEFGQRSKSVIVRGDNERSARGYLWSVLMSDDERNACSLIDMIDMIDDVEDSSVGVWEEM